jgi:hypothetical protein
VLMLHRSPGPETTQSGLGGGKASPAGGAGRLLRPAGRVAVQD